MLFGVSRISGTGATPDPTIISSATSLLRSMNITGLTKEMQQGLVVMDHLCLLQ